MSEPSDTNQNELREQLTTLRHLNDRLSRLLEDEHSRREQAYREAEDLPAPVAGSRTNMDLVAELGGAFERDHEYREDVEGLLDGLEGKQRLAAKDLIDVQDAVAARVWGLRDEMERRDIERIVDTLAHDFDARFLR